MSGDRWGLSGARWVLKESAPAAVEEIAAAVGVPAIVAAALVNRGLNTVEQAREFLYAGTDDLLDPHSIPGMEQAVAIIREAIAAGHAIRICGDYDVDGVSATALLVRALTALGARADYYLPHRVRDGYGLNRQAVEQAAADGIGLLITADCGTGAVEPIAAARAAGISVIVVDHHRPAERLPDADVILNPLCADGPEATRQLAAVGVAYQLVAALARACGVAPGAPHRFLDLVALGTVADVVPLLGENRILLREGLRRLRGTRKVGLRSLMRVSGITPDRLGSRQIAFGLGPRLNAAGRIEHARIAAELLLTSDTEEADRLAADLDGHNQQRQDQEARMLEEAEALIAQSVDLDRERVIVVASEGWLPGVVGIVASRLVDRYHRPAVLIALEDGRGRGSGRSITGFHLWEALRQAREHLVHFGGHAMAAGLTVEQDRIPDLRRALNDYARDRLAPEQLQPTIVLDAWAQPSELTAGLVSQLNSLAPFGAGNPTPVLASQELTLIGIEELGPNGDHARLRVQEVASQCRAEAVWFRCGELVDRLSPGQTLDICYVPEIDEWRGGGSVRMLVRDVAVGDR
jgi:single-stranded-DNA-specific exonuclease